MGASSRPTRRPGCCVTLGKLQFAHPRRIAVAATVFPLIRTVMADAGHQSRKLARALKRHEGWKLIIIKRGQRAFKIRGRPESWSVALRGSGATGG